MAQHLDHPVVDGVADRAHAVELLVDVAIPQVRRLHHVPVGIDDEMIVAHVVPFRSAVDDRELLRSALGGAPRPRPAS